MIHSVLSGQEKRSPRITWDRFSLDLDKKTCLMGILNCTPDSFSDGGRYISPDDALLHAADMVASGADIIDIGGESTRPGARPVTADQEIERVVPVIEKLKRSLDIPISIDTNKASVAQTALESGASMVNDITGLKGDPDMAKVVAAFGVPVIAMHIKGRPQTMQNAPCYKDLISEIIDSLRESIDIARFNGIAEDMVIIDPGIGFGKTLEHNLRIIRELYRFKTLGRPIMVGPSRKSFIGQVLNREVEGRLMGTAASIALAIANGASIVRVHDIKEMRDVAIVSDAICKT